MPPALAVHGLEKRFGSVQALKGVDLEVAEGELVGLLGPNGAGKSTLVKIAVGLVRPTAGSVDVAGAPRRIARRAGCARLPRGAVPLPGLVHGGRGAGAAPAARGLARRRGRAGAPARARRARGRRRRAASTACRRACSSASASRRRSIGEPRVLLLDEPTSALDPVGRRTVRLLLEQLRDRGVSVLLNSHLLSEIELVCDRVAILLDGAFVATGTPSELVAAARRRPRDRRGRSPRRGRDPRGRAPARRRGGRRRPPRLRRPRAHVDARGHVSRSGGRGDGLSGVAVIVEYGFREAVRRKVFAVVLLLTALFLFLFWLANHYVFGELSNISPPARRARRHAHVRRCVPDGAGDVRDAVPRRRARRVPDARSRSPATRSAGCCSRSSSGRSDGRRCCCRGSSAQPASASRTCSPSTSRPWRSRG